MSGRTRRIWLLTGAAGLLLVATSCSKPEVVAVSAKSQPSGLVAPPVDPNTPPPEPALNGGIVDSEILGSVDYTAEVNVDGNKPSMAHDEMVGLAAADLERWWSEQYPLVFGGPFEPLEGGIFPAYPGNTTKIPACDYDGGYFDYYDIQERLAFYCTLTDSIAFDEGSDSLLTLLSDEFSPAVYTVMLSHEYGHAIQQRAAVGDVPTIYTEQQADCYSGAWFRQSYDGNSPLLRLGDEDIKTSLIAMLYIRDPVGTSSMDFNAHGSAFDRVGAFQEGFLKGPARCAELIDAPLELIPNEFVDGASSDLEIYTVGNAPYDCSELDRDEMINDGFDPERADQIIDACVPGPEFLKDDLNDFWQTAIGSDFPELDAVPVDNLDVFTCDDLIRLDQFVALCPSQQLVAYDGDDVSDLYHEVGDFTLGYLYSIAWAEAAQIYIQSPLVGEERALLNDCYTGAWVRDITPNPEGSPPRARDEDGDGFPDNVTSSPGDLDEATKMALITGDVGSNTNVIGNGFEKIAALRRGVLGGYDACAAQLPAS